MKELSINPNAKGLIFDLDGTLLDSMPLHYEAWHEICSEELDYDFTEKFFYDNAGVSSNRIFEKIKILSGLEFNHNEMANRKEELYESKIHKLKVRDQLVNIVKEYHGKLPMAIGTGSPGEGSWKAVKAVGLDKYLKIMVSKEMVEHPKPAPDTFLKCAELIGIYPEDCQVFEDGDPGIQAAKTAGMMVIDIREYI
ncbi:HAD family hydrolase [Bacteroidota bacterium]